MLIVRGTFHQGDTDKFGSDSVGRQCTANAAVAIVMGSIRNVQLWTYKNVDSILKVGDEIYKQSMTTRRAVSNAEKNYMYLNAQEFVPDITLDSITRRIKVELAYLGHLNDNIFGCLNLKERLHEFLENYGAAILTANNI